MDVLRFAQSADALAGRFERQDLPGLLRKRLDVPADAVALARGDGGAAQVVGGGQSADVARDGLLVRALWRLDFDVDAGRSKDDLPFRAALTLELRPRATAIDLQQLERTLLGQAPELDRARASAHFEPWVREAMRLFVGARAAADLAAGDPRAALEAHLREDLRKPLFEAGCELHDVVHPKLASDAWERRREAQAEAAAKAAALAREEELIEAKKRLDRASLLKDIELRDEADRARKDRRLARYEELRARMGDDDVKALVLLLDDDRQRAALIRELIDKDMTDEQRRKMQLGEMEARVEERLAELQQKLAQLGGGGLERRDDPITRRVLCVVGKRVLAFDPKTNLHPEAPKEVYDAEAGALGYLRSVRFERVAGHDWVLAGAQRGVYRLGLDARHEYAFPREPDGKGGANAVAYFDGRLYATHSELGLCEWPLDGGKGRFLCGEHTADASSTRGAWVHDGRLFFSSGNDVLAIDLMTGSDKPVRFRGAEDSITAFVVQGQELVAGTKSGRLYRWGLDDPGSPEAFHVVKKNPIYMLRHARIAGHGFYVIGSKDFTVTAAEPRRDVFREYQAREEVRWVDAAADFVFGVTRSGYKVLAWDALRQTEPVLTIRVSDKVQDLFVVKQAPGASA